jgi:hypothetical protein
LNYNEDYEDYEEGFVMSGDIQVEDQIQSSQSSPSPTASSDITQEKSNTVTASHSDLCHRLGCLRNDN